MATYYCSPAGSGTTCSLGSPCGLQAGLDKAVGGDTLYLRSGTYSGKFTATNSGTLGNRITIQNYPTEVPVIDGYVTTTLTTAITTTVQSTLSLADGSKFPVGSQITIADQPDPSDEEQLSLADGTPPNYSNVQRSLNGTTAQTHANGATVVLGGAAQMYVTGSYITFQGIRLTSSDPVREQSTPNSQNSPHLRGSGFYNLGDFNAFINCVVHDNQDGIFNGNTSSGTEIYGCLVYNNGYVAGGVYNGHGLYMIHSDASNPALIKDNLILNNASLGIKEDSQGSDTINIDAIGNALANSGSWASGLGATGNLLSASNNGVAQDITVVDNFFYFPSGANATNLKLGLGGVSNGTLVVTGNYIANGIAVAIEEWSPLTFTGNTIRATNNTGGGNSTVILYEPHSSPSSTWNNNTYWNQITSGLGYFPGGGSSSRTFAQWKTDTSFDAASTQTLTAPTANWTALRINTHDSSRALLVIYKWVAAGTAVDIDPSSFLSGGDGYAIYPAENPSTSVLSGTYTSGNLSVPMDGTAVVAPIGANGTTIKTPTTTRPTFQAFIMTKNAATSGGSASKGVISFGGTTRIL